MADRRKKRDIGQAIDYEALGLTFTESNLSNQIGSEQVSRPEDDNRLMGPYRVIRALMASLQEHELISTNGVDMSLSKPLSEGERKLFAVLGLSELSDHTQSTKVASIEYVRSFIEQLRDPASASVAAAASAIDVDHAQEASDLGDDLSDELSDEFSAELSDELSSELNSEQSSELSSELNDESDA